MIIECNEIFYPVDLRQVQCYSRKDKINPHCIIIKFWNGNKLELPFCQMDETQRFVRDVSQAKVIMGCIKGEIEKLFK